MLQALKDMANDHLNQYRTTLEQDEYHTKKIKDLANLSRKELAMLVRRDEKRTISKAVTTLAQNKLVLGEKETAQIPLGKKENPKDRKEL